MAALRQVPLVERRTMFRVLCQGWTYARFAETYMCCEATVGRRIQRGLELMARLLWDDDGHPRQPDWPLEDA